MLHPPGWLALGVVLVLSLLTFVPIRYLYPSQPGPLNRVSSLLAVVWSFLLVWILWQIPSYEIPDGQAGGDSVRRIALISLVFPASYMVASWAISLRLRLMGRP